MDAMTQFIEHSNCSLTHYRGNNMSHIETLRAALTDLSEHVVCSSRKETEKSLERARAALAATAEPEQSTEPTITSVEMAAIEKTKALDAFILRAGFSYGWRNLESGGRRMAEHGVEQNATLTAQLAAMTAQYQELIYQVGKKYPGESRHQTALRYLGQAEQDDTDYSVADH